MVDPVCRTQGKSTRTSLACASALSYLCTAVINLKGTSCVPNTACTFFHADPNIG